MNFSAVLGMGLAALTRNRMRLVLTTLGIVIGVAAVIATLAIGQGARSAVQAQIRAMGANVLMVMPGTVTSGGFSPTLSAPIAMGYVRKDLAANGTALHLMVRGKPLPARVVPMPFVPHRYAR